jgi:hypothetical protein
VDSLFSLGGGSVCDGAGRRRSGPIVEALLQKALDEAIHSEHGCHAGRHSRRVSCRTSVRSGSAGSCPRAPHAGQLQGLGLWDEPSPHSLRSRCPCERSEAILHAVSKENARKFFRVSSLLSSAISSSSGLSLCQTISPCTDTPILQCARRKLAL